MRECRSVPPSVLGKLLEDARHLTPHTTQLWNWGSQLGRRLLGESGQALNAEPCGTSETYNLGPELQAALEESASQGLPAVPASHCSSTARPPTTAPPRLTHQPPSTAPWVCSLFLPLLAPPQDRCSVRGQGCGALRGGKEQRGS